MTNPFKILCIAHQMAKAEKMENKEIENIIKSAEAIITDNTELMMELDDNECKTLAEFIRKVPSQAKLYNIIDARLYTKFQDKQSGKTNRNPSGKEINYAADKYFANVYEEAEEIIDYLEMARNKNRNALLYAKTLKTLLTEMENRFGTSPIVEEDTGN